KMDIGQLIAEHFPGMKVAVVGNIPYNITSPLITGLLSGGYGLESVTVMIQKEPADRFCSEPGTENCGAVSALVWYYGIPRKLFEVGPGAFRPRPKVTSSVISIEIRRVPAVQTKDRDMFLSVIRAAFGQRRKTAANSLSSLLGEPKDLVRKAFEDAGLPESIRAERMTLEDFADLTEAILVLKAGKN
ncbi:MAG: 16S rRNA (adenine(1518)-N(6)/adenine(1519)-N(6))-dimethyltransferase, partial [Oscillospiraceae bacterium]|nr:16S rRNA (adenine(1518)-N(6)/adenine(1519)-N(6))-dimethyltransferase [Oscillospiraceae bacterium]